MPLTNVPLEHCTQFVVPAIEMYPEGHVVPTTCRVSIPCCKRFASNTIDSTMISPLGPNWTLRPTGMSLPPASGEESM